MLTRMLSTLLLALAVAAHPHPFKRFQGGKKQNGGKKRMENQVLVRVEALVSGTASTVPFEQVNAIAALVGGELVPTESFFLPTEATVRPLVQATFSVLVPSDGDVMETEDSLIAISEELRMANVIRLTGTELVGDDGGKKKGKRNSKRKDKKKNMGGKKQRKKTRNQTTRFLQDSAPLFILDLTACPSMCGSPIITDEDLDAAMAAGIPIEDLGAALLFSGYCLPSTDSCVCTGSYGGNTCDVPCKDLKGAGQCNGATNCAWCETTGKCLATPGPARTQDEIVLCPGCSELSGNEPACVGSSICDYCASSRICFDSDDPAFECSFSLVKSSPVNGEIDVAVTRETVLHFSEAVDRATVSSSSIVVKTQGQEIDSTVVHVSVDGRTVTVFYPENLPANSKVNVQGKSSILTESGKSLETFHISFTTLGLIPVANTYVCGRVFASGYKMLPDGSSLAETPLVGVAITVDGAEGSINAVTDVDGAFVLGPTPSGTFFVHIDGRTSPQGEEIGGAGAYFPFVGKSWTAVAGKMNNKETIYLPLISPGALKVVSDTETTAVGFTADIIEENPNFAGVSLRVPPGALIDPAGTEGPGDKMVGIAPVDPDRLPGQLPETLRFPVVITIQTSGGNNFDSPVPVCFPNLPDPVTGQVLSPGDSTSLWSFNHDTGRFEIVGPATISDDGLLSCSDDGFGILAPGWHGVSPGTSTDGPDDQEECEAGNECCQGGPNGGSPNPGKKDTFSQYVKDFNAVKGCLDIVMDKVIKKKYQDAYNCGSAIWNFGSQAYSDNVSRPTGAQEVVDRIASVNANKWGIIKGCAGVGLTAFLPISTGFQLGLALYKCGRNAQKSIKSNLCDSNNAGCGDGPTSTAFCSASNAAEEALSAVDTFISTLEGFNLLRRKLVEFPEVISESEMEGIVINNFYGSDVNRYGRTMSAQNILDGLEAVQAAADAGDAEAVAMYETFVEDMLVVREYLQVTVLDLYQPIQQISESNQGVIGSMNDYLVDRVRFANGGTKTFRELYIYLKTEDDDEFRIKTTPTGNIIGLTLPQNKNFFYYAYNVQDNVFGIAQGTTSGNGIPTILPNIGLSVVDDESLVDTDGDGLCDLCEFTIGTNPSLADSDEDGTGDLQELLAGTNPLDGLALSTGVVATVPLVMGRGNPLRLELSESFVFVIMDGGGIAVYNVFNALQPALVALLSPERNFVEVSADSNRLLARTSVDELVLFSGTEFSELQELLSLYPRLLNVPISSIHMSSQFAFVGTTLGSVLIFESDFGSHVQTLSTLMSDVVLDLALTPVGTITCVMNSVVIFFEPSEEGVALWKETPIIGSIQSSQSYSLQVGTSTALTVSFQGGLDVLSTDGTPLGSSAAFPTPTFDCVVTEEGGGDIVIQAFNGVEVWDITDANSPTFGARFEVDGILRTPLLASGAGFMYLGTSNGLVVLNTNPADVFGNPPSILRLGAVYRGVMIASGETVEERRILSIFADVDDDVAIQNVIFSANGAQLKIDSSFPFSATVTVPPFDVSTSLNISAIAWDTAGNMAEEVVLQLGVTEDITPPSLLKTSPADGSSIAFEENEEKIEISVSFIEPFVGTVDGTKLSIRQLEPEMRDVDPNLLEFLPNPGLGEVGISVPVTELPLGKYQVQVDAGFIFDVNGNPSGSEMWEFTVTIASNVRTAIAVIDESNSSQGYVDAKWAEFRARFPDRPFCLLRPFGDFGFLNIPAGFDGIYSDVNRDGGNPDFASDWFTICKLNEINPLIRKVGLFVDNSGSMTISTVAASLNLFLQKVAQANLETVEVYRGDELWIDVFLVDL